MTHFGRTAIALATIGLLTACSTTETTESVQDKPVETAQATPLAQNPKAIAECALYKEAMMRSPRVKGELDTQIVLGCPGYEHVRDTTNRFSASGDVLSALGAKVPQSALSYGKIGKNFFHKMIVRGIPPKVATDLADEQLFADVIAAYR